MSGFVLDLATLRPTLNRVEADVPARDVGLPEGEWRGLVHADLRVEKSGKRVAVQGTVRSTARLECERCLREFDLVIEAPLVVLSERSQKSSRDEERDLERDHHMLFHDGRRVDLAESVREVLLLELPISPHCREDCPGLCLKCGADLNDGPCACARG